MASETLSAQMLKERLEEDAAIETAQERCRLYVELFLTGHQTRDFWSEQEYHSLAGGKCREFDPYDLVEGSG